MRILLIEDDKEIAQFIFQYLNTKGLAVTICRQRDEINKVLKKHEDYDCIIMDRLIENFDMKYLVPDLREHWPTAPLIVLSAISTPEEKTELLNMGVDDYLGKPFSAGELHARIQARLRYNQNQSPNNSEQFLQMGNTVVDVIKRKVTVSHEQISLPSKEFLLLQNLMKDPGKIWSKMDLLESVWGTYLKTETNVVETTIMNLRKKLADLGSNLQIKNSRNSGYWLES
ncbi:MAG: response regulator transcription factor [Bdellovibrionaceae bacterium]|nr:response regulator transcription factor [Pseudobdellovibrionaceae bacterium]